MRQFNEMSATPIQKLIHVVFDFEIDIEGLASYP